MPELATTEHPDVQLPEPPPPTPEDEAMRDMVAEVVDNLSPKSRFLIEAVYYEGLTPAQLARRLNVPARTVSHWLKAARDEAKPLLEALVEERYNRSGRE
jgi:RNA polymerase sigma factor (sigma-70 family)